jgi:methionine sulfoxide reductase heme-binding subunit
MSTEQRVKVEPAYSPWRVVLSVLATIFIVGLVVVGAILAMTPAGQSIASYLNFLFAANTVQIWWYVTRASGIIGYLLLWFSTVLGLAVTSKYMDAMLDRMFTYDFHQFISLLSIAFILLHIIVLTVDRYLPYSVAQILVPFISPYRPFWVGIGVISFYVIVLVTVTFYLRKQISMRSFRIIHYLSLAGYLGSTLHGYYSGTDTALPAMQWLYKLSGLVVLFFTIYWLVLLAFRNRERKLATSRPAGPPVERKAITR